MFILGVVFGVGMVSDEFRTLAEDRYGEQVAKLDDSDLDELEALFDEKMDEYGSERIALTAAVGEFNFDRHSSGGPTEDVEMYVLGANGPRPFGKDDNGNKEYAVIGKALVVLEDRPVGLASVVCQGPNLDHSLDHITQMFSEDFFSPLGVRATVNEVDQMDSAYVVNPVDGDPWFDVEDRTLSHEEVRRQFEQRVDRAEIARVGESLSRENDDGYTVGFGVDMKRLEFATVLDANVTDKAGRYVVMDESYLEPSELSPQVRGEDEEAGLVLWTNPDIMAVEEESLVNVWGAVSPDSDGKVEMRAVGWEPAGGDESLVNHASVPDGDSGGSSESSDTGSDPSESFDDDGGSSGTTDERTI